MLIFNVYLIITKISIMFGELKKNIGITSIILKSSVYNGFSMNNVNNDAGLILDTTYTINTITTYTSRQEFYNTLNLNENNRCFCKKIVFKAGLTALGLSGIGALLYYFLHNRNIFTNKGNSLDFKSIKHNYTDNILNIVNSNINYATDFIINKHVVTSIIGHKKDNEDKKIVNKNDCECLYDLCPYYDIFDNIKYNIRFYEENVDYCFGYMEKDYRDKIIYQINGDNNCIFTSMIKYVNAFKGVYLHKLDVLYNDFKDLTSFFADTYIDCLDLTNLEIKNAESIDFMFKNAKIKNIIGLDNINHFKNNVSLTNTFYDFGGMSFLNLSSWYLKPILMINPFRNINVEKLDVSNIYITDYLNFYLDIFYSKYLKEIHILNWDTRHIKHISDFFFNYDVLQKVYLNIDNNQLIVSVLREHGFICNNDLCSKKTSISNNLPANI